MLKNLISNNKLLKNIMKIKEIIKNYVFVNLYYKLKNLILKSKYKYLIKLKNFKKLYLKTLYH
jgi:hypothetical protein